jgi:hypothetical protein
MENLSCSNLPEVVKTHVNRTDVNTGLLEALFN